MAISQPMPQIGRSRSPFHEGEGKGEGSSSGPHSDYHVEHAKHVCPYATDTERMHTSQIEARPGGTTDISPALMAMNNITWSRVVVFQPSLRDFCVSRSGPSTEVLGYSLRVPLGRRAVSSSTRYIVHGHQCWAKIACPYGTNPSRLHGHS